MIKTVKARKDYSCENYHCNKAIIKGTLHIVQILPNTGFSNSEGYGSFNSYQRFCSKECFEELKNG